MTTFVEEKSNEIARGCGVRCEAFVKLQPATTEFKCGNCSSDFEVLRVQRCIGSNTSSDFSRMGRRRDNSRAYTKDKKIYKVDPVSDVTKTCVLVGEFYYYKTPCPTRKQELRMKQLMPFILNTNEFSLSDIKECFQHVNRALWKLNWFTEPLDHNEYLKRCGFVEKCLYRGFSLPRISRELSRSGSRSFTVPVVAQSRAFRTWIDNYGLFCKVFMRDNNEFNKFMKLYSKTYRCGRYTEEKRPHSVEAQMFSWFSKGMVKEAVQELPPKSQEFLENPAKSLISEVGSQLGDIVSDFFLNWPSKIGAFAEFAVGSLGSEFLNNILEWLKNGYRAVREKIEWLWTCVTPDGWGGNVVDIITIFFFIVVLVSVKALYSTVKSLVVAGLTMLFEALGYVIDIDIVKGFNSIFEEDKPMSQGFSMSAGLLATVSYLVVHMLKPTSMSTYGSFVNIVSRSGPLMDNITEIFIDLIDGIYYSVTESHLFATKEATAEFDKFMTDLVAFAQIPDLPRLVLVDPEKTRALASFVSRGANIKYAVAMLKGPMTGVFLKNYEALRMLNESALANADMYKKRIETVMVWMTGAPGQGKTLMLKTMPEVLHKMFLADSPHGELPPWSPNLVFEKCKDSEHWETYSGQQYCTINEALNKKDEITRAKELSQIQTICDDAPMPLNMAFEGKGKTFFVSDLLFVTTNISNQEIAGGDRTNRTGMTCPLSLIRRQTFPLVVTRGETLLPDCSNAEKAWNFTVIFPECGRSSTSAYWEQAFLGMSRFLQISPKSKDFEEGRFHKQFVANGCKFTFTFYQIVDAIYKETCFRRRRNDKGTLGSRIPAPVPTFNSGEAAKSEPEWMGPDTVGKWTNVQGQNEYKLYEGLDKLVVKTIFGAKDKVVQADEFGLPLWAQNAPHFDDSKLNEKYDGTVSLSDKPEAQMFRVRGFNDETMNSTHISIANSHLCDENYTYVGLKAKTSLLKELCVDVKREYEFRDCFGRYDKCDEDRVEVLDFDATLCPIRFFSPERSLNCKLTNALDLSFYGSPKFTSNFGTLSFLDHNGDLRPGCPDIEDNCLESWIFQLCLRGDWNDIRSVLRMIEKARMPRHLDRSKYMMFNALRARHQFPEVKTCMVWDETRFAKLIKPLCKKLHMPSFPSLVAQRILDAETPETRTMRFKRIEMGLSLLESFDFFCRRPHREMYPDWCPETMCFFDADQNHYYPLIFSILMKIFLQTYQYETHVFNWCVMAEDGVLPFVYDFMDGHFACFTTRHYLSALLNSWDPEGSRIVQLSKNNKNSVFRTIVNYCGRNPDTGDPHNLNFGGFPIVEGVTYMAAEKVADTAKTVSKTCSAVAKSFKETIEEGYNEYVKLRKDCPYYKWLLYGGAAVGLLACFVVPYMRQSAGVVEAKPLSEIFSQGGVVSKPMQPDSQSVVHRTEYNPGRLQPGVQSMVHKTEYVPTGLKPGAQANAQSFDETIGRANKIGSNLRLLKFCYYGGRVVKSWALMSGHSAILTAHVMRGHGDNFEVLQILAHGDGVEFALTRSQCTLRYADEGGLGNGNRDIVFIDLNPKVLGTTYPDLSNYCPCDSTHNCSTKLARVQVNVVGKNFGVLARMSEHSVAYKPGTTPLEANFDGVNGRDSVISNNYIIVHGLAGRSGDCSLPYVSVDSTTGVVYLEGVHVAGCGADSYAVPIYKTDFVRVTNAQGFGMPHDVYISDFILNNMEFGQPVTGVPFGASVFGTLKKTNFIPSKTCFVPSPFQGNGVTPPLYEVSNAPAALCPFVSMDGEVVRPLQKAATKQFAVDKSQPMPDWVTGLFESHPGAFSEGFFGNWSLVKGRPLRKLTVQEAVFGIASELISIDTTTSEGILLRLKGLKREHVVRLPVNQDPGYIDQFIYEEIERIQEAVRDGKLPKLVTIAALKDELRDLERVRLGKTRLFHVGDFIHMIWMRMVLGDLMRFLKAHRSQTSGSIGTNPHSQDWKILFDEMTRKSYKYGAGDYSGYDTGLRAQFGYWMGVECAEFYGYPQCSFEYWEVVYACMSASSPLMIIGRVVYYLVFANPSGGFATGFFNTYCNNCIFGILFLIAQDECNQQSCDCGLSEGSLKDLFKKFYGDDNLWGIYEQWSHHWDMKKISSKINNMFGMTYTTPDKGDVESDFIELEDMEFLKRKWRSTEGGSVVYGTLDMESIRSMLLWIRDTGSQYGNTQQLITNLGVAGMEMYYYGRREFELWRDEVVAACSLYNVNCKIETYEYHHTRFMNNL